MTATAALLPVSALLTVPPELPLLPPKGMFGAVEPQIAAPDGPLVVPDRMLCVSLGASRFPAVLLDTA